VDFGGPDGYLAHKSFKIQNTELKGDEALSVLQDTLSTWQLNLHYYSLNVNLPLQEHTSKRGSVGNIAPTGSYRVLHM